MKLLELFPKSNYKKNQNEFRIEKVIKRKGEIHMLNSWIDKNDIV